MRDRQLSRNFRLSEAPGWEHATEAEVRALEETVARVLQPVRDRFGRVRITSWMRWSDGSRRTGSHGQSGGTVDFVPMDAPVRDVWEWGKVFLLPAGYIGRWIYEPRTAAQGEHIHAATRADMLAHRGDGRIQALEELADGTYALRMELPAVDGMGVPAVSRAGPGGVVALLLGLGLLFGLARGTPTPTI